MVHFVSKGFRNDFKDALDKLDHEYMDQLARQQVQCERESICVCACVCVCTCV